MAIGLASENNLPPKYNRKAIENEEMMLISVGRTNLKVPFHAFASVANALSIFAPKGKPTMEPGWTITLRDGFSDKEITVVASALPHVMAAITTFAVKKGIYIPEIPAIEETEEKSEADSGQPTQATRRPGRRSKKASAAEVEEPAVETTTASTEPMEVDETPKAGRKVGGRKAKPSETVQQVETAAEETTAAPKKRGRPKKAAAAVPSSTTVAEPSSQKVRGRKSKAPSPEQAIGAPEVAPPEAASAVATGKKRGRKAKEAIASDKAPTESVETLITTPAAEKPPTRRGRPKSAEKVTPVATEPRARGRKKQEAATATQVSDEQAAKHGEPLTVPDYVSGPLPKALVADHAKPETSVTGKGIPAYMAPYHMAYLLEGDFRFDFTPLQTDGKNRRHVLGVPTDPAAPSVPGYEIKSRGDHVGWIIVEEKTLIVTGLPKMRDSTQGAANGSVEGVVRKILFGVAPALDRIRSAA